MGEMVKKEVEHIAELARIKFEKNEKEKITSELKAVLGYIDKLKEVNTEGTEPIAHITGMENVLRKDEPSKKPLENQAADAAKLVVMAPAKKDNFVKVKSVFGE